MARPSKSDAEKLTKRVAFRMTEADHDVYTARVKDSGLTDSAFFRECVLTNKTEVIAKESRTDEQEKILFLVRKASNNINQMAHRLHTDSLAEKIDQKTYIAVLEELQHLSQYLKATLVC
jgi:rubrerythrin